MIKTKLYMVKTGTYKQNIEFSKLFFLIKCGPAQTGPGQARTGLESWNLMAINEQICKTQGKYMIL